MINRDDNTVLSEILSPVLPLLKEEADKLKKDADTYKLSLYFFTVNLLYGCIKGTKSIALLVTEIRHSPDARALGLVVASQSMYSEAFNRYTPASYRRIFYGLLERLSFLEIPEIRTLGRLLCIDGSVFPAFRTMDWANYQTSSNAIKIHLAFELNRMLPVQFLCTDANSSERKALLAMLEAGVTYIADRGYVCFSMFHAIAEKQAYFLVRTKTNLRYLSKEVLTPCIPPQWSLYVSEVTDTTVQCINDKEQAIYRLVTFAAMGETYFMITNRFDLKTHEVIMLYAHRWQVELFFRCLKRTLNALHLWSHDPKGVQIHFYVYLISYVLLLHFKQRCELKNDPISRPLQSDERCSGDPPNTTSRCLPESRIPPACGVVSLFGGKLRRYWKIGIHWLSTVRNLLLQPVTPDVGSFSISRGSGYGSARRWEMMSGRGGMLLAPERRSER